MNRTMKILIAYDGSDCSKEALNDLKRAGLPRETEALVVSVCDVALPPPDAAPFADLLKVPQARLIAYEMEARLAEERAQALRAVEEAHELAEEAVRQLKSDFPLWDVRAESMAGTPASAVIKEADDWNADLIVVGTHGRTALGRLILGSVSQKVAAEAHCSVRVARCPVEKSGSPIRLVIGVDGGAGARAAVRAVTQREWPASSEARVIVADNYLKPSGAGSTGAAEEQTASANELVEMAKEDLRAVAGLHVSSEIIEGDPKSILIGEAKKFDADCIFIGSGNSDSAAVLSGAHCTVEVVRAR